MILTIYITVYPVHEKLIELLKRYGFVDNGHRKGGEYVLIRNLLDGKYPSLIASSSTWLLPIYPEFHTRLFPDSILKTEDISIIQDVSETNSIHKVYIAKMFGMEKMRAGDILIIYRTKYGGPGEYTSVATSLCVLEEYRNINSFNSKEEFICYCEPHSVFTKDELSRWWVNKQYPHVIKFTYNIALKKRPNRQQLIDELGFPHRETRYSFMKLDSVMLKNILKFGEISERFIVY